MAKKLHAKLELATAPDVSARNVVLELRQVGKQFGGIDALADVSFAVPRGKITGIIGPNGAGKSTLINVISGYLRPSAGEIYLEASSIGQVASHKLVGKGIARTFQRTQLFPQLTVLQNLVIAGYAGCDLGVLGGLWQIARERGRDADLGRRACDVLASIGLVDLANVRAGALAHAQQRIIEVCRALVLQPKVLLLDEPAGGMTREEMSELANLLRELRERGTTILLVEHCMPLVMAVCDKLVVMNFGRTIADGAPQEVRCDPAVIDAYLGGGASVAAH